MRVPPGYQPDEPVHRGRRSAVTRATRIASGDRVVLKISAAADGSARAQHEHRVAARIQSAHVVRTLGVEHYEDRVVLVQEAFGNTSLAQLLRSGPIEVEQALELGVQVALGLAEIHAHDVTHRAIHPGNIVVDTASFAAKIIDFAEASTLDESGDAQRLDESAIPLAYISPEQTGRMNRKLDHRTDFYSLGATLYHALAGRPPFAASDPLTLVHAHIALQHDPLHTLDARIPRQVSLVADKLLAKNAEERYQSARGIAADLAECLRQYRLMHRVEAFPLGGADVPEKFVIPPRLYGRSEERQQLLEAFSAAAEGSKRLLLISGYSGVGKSSLVQEIHQLIAPRRATFASGKFDPLQQQAPYSVIAQALSQLCRGLLSLPEAELADWRREILERVAHNAGLITAIAPDVQRVIGTQPAVPNTGLIEAQQRLHLTLCRFLGAFASPARPLVLFFDDLHWADPATLNALGAIMRLPEPKHLLVICAYRDNEVDAGHPLALALDEYRRASVEIQSLPLSGLSEDEIAALVADTLHRAPHEVESLARLVWDKTSGNPFFVAEFLRELHQQKALRFEGEQRGFCWDLPQIEALGISANVVDLMLRKFDRLPGETRQIVQLAAAVGSRFDLELLADAAALDKSSTRARLEPAIRARLIVPLDPHYPLDPHESANENGGENPNYRYRFLHDRVQQAAYDNIAEVERPSLHLALGRILTRRSGPALRRERAFEIADQWNRGASLLRDPMERIGLARINLEAGQRARDTSAYQEARGYLRRGLDQLSMDAFRDDYALASALHLRYAECLYLCGEFDEAHAFSEVLLPKLRSPFEQAELYSIGMELETNRGQFIRALDLARAALDVLDYPAPGPAAIVPLLAAKARVTLAMRGKSIEDLARLPELHDRRLIAVVSVLSHMYAPAYYADKKSMFFWAIHENLRIALEHGVTAATASGYTSYGMFLIAAMRDYEGAEAFGRLALGVVERLNAFALRCRVHHVVGTFTHGYSRNHLRGCPPFLVRAFEHGLESGDLVYACTAAAMLPAQRFMVGDPLEDVCRDAEQRERAIISFQQIEMTNSLRAFRQLLRCLRGETSGRTSLTTSDCDERELIAAMRTTPGQLARHYHAMCRVLLHTLFCDYDEAVEHILENDRSISQAMAGLVQLTEYDFYACIALVQGLRKRTYARSAARLLAKKRRLLARCARSAPLSFRHKQLLVSAELDAFTGRHERATQLYDAAIREANANGFAHHAALACELAAASCMRRGLTEVARAYRQAARSGYLQWGALGKVRALDEDFPDGAPCSPGHARTALPLDTESVVRASQALSSEIALKALLERVLRVIVQTAGAQRGSLMVEHAGELRVEAQLDLPRGLLIVPPSAAGDQALPVCEAIVRYSLRTGEDVVLAHAAQSEQFRLDPYVIEHASKSILCVPVRHRDRITGALFLENELSCDVFTRERLEVLRLLVAQAAISLENARLYESTQQLNVELGVREALLRAFLDGMPAGVHVVDGQGRLVFSNRAANEILGRPADPGRRVEELPTYYHAYLAGTDQLYPPDRTQLARALRGERSVAEDIELHLPDRVVPLSVWGTPIWGEDGAVQYAIVAFQDISDKRAAETNRARLEEQLRQAERLEAIGRLAGGVAHDFNNLLTPILAYSELTRAELPAGSSIAKSIEHIHEAAEQAAELTRSLLAFGRRHVLDARVLDLNLELTRFESMLRRLIRENIVLELRCDPRLGRVRADPSQLRRVIMNLALNAADAMPSGGRLLIETEQCLDPASLMAANGDAPQGPCCVLRVSDTGHGMDQDTLTKIFDPFFTTKRPGEGTGLGLPTVYGLVKQHGGQIFVRSTIGNGTSFEVFLPQLGPDELSDAGRDQSTRRLSRPPAARSGVVMVVEDDAAVRDVMREVLVREGHRVVDAAGPTEALEIAGKLDVELELLVTDVIMPVMNGRELFQELVRQTPRLAVLFVSGYSGDAISENGLLDPGIEFMPKPLEIDALRLRVRELLAKRDRIVS